MTNSFRSTATAATFALVSCAAVGCATPRGDTSATQIAALQRECQQLREAQRELGQSLGDARADARRVADDFARVRHDWDRFAASYDPGLRGELTAKLAAAESAARELVAAETAARAARERLARLEREATELRANVAALEGEAQALVKDGAVARLVGELSQKIDSTVGAWDRTLVAAQLDSESAKAAALDAQQNASYAKATANEARETASRAKSVAESARSSANSAERNARNLANTRPPQ